MFKWINTFNVPHFYVQVFFDAMYVISFAEILGLLQSSEINERGRTNKKMYGYKNGSLAFVIEKNPKNQYKETIHLFLSNGHVLTEKMTEPSLAASRKELAGGRLLHYISFGGGTATLDTKLLRQLVEKPC